MPPIPTKRCDDPKKHDPHDWKESKHFKRWCPGRITDRPAPRVRPPSRRNRRV